MNYISLYKYAKQQKIPKSTLYFLVKEGRFKPEDLLIETQKKIRIKEDAKPLIKTYQ